MERHLRLLDTVLASHAIANWPDGLTEFLRSLFQQCFKQYAVCVKGNPIDHHITVLKNTMDIAARQTFAQSEIKCITCTALAHDIYTPEKKRKGDDASADSEATRKYSRAVHMFHSSIRAAEALAEVNQTGFLNHHELAWIQAMTAVHDNPSAEMPLPFEKDVLAFREADRLWMISVAGFTFDLLKDIRKLLTAPDAKNECNLEIPDRDTWNDFEKRQTYIDNAKNDGDQWSVVQKLAANRVTHIGERYEDDAAFYPAAMREQLHAGTLFYTEAGYELYMQKRQEVCRLYEVSAMP